MPITLYGVRGTSRIPTCLSCQSISVNIRVTAYLLELTEFAESTEFPCRLKRQCPAGNCRVSVSFIRIDLDMVVSLTARKINKMLVSYCKPHFITFLFPYISKNIIILAL